MLNHELRDGPGDSRRKRDRDRAGLVLFDEFKGFYEGVANGGSERLVRVLGRIEEVIEKNRNASPSKLNDVRHVAGQYRYERRTRRPIRATVDRGRPVARG